MGFIGLDRVPFFFFSPCAQVGHSSSIASTLRLRSSRFRGADGSSPAQSSPVTSRGRGWILHSLHSTHHTAAELVLAGIRGPQATLPIQGRNFWGCSGARFAWCSWHRASASRVSLSLCPDRTKAPFCAPTPRTSFQRDRPPFFVDALVVPVHGLQIPVSR